MIRALAMLVIAIFGALALIASNRVKPMLTDQHGSGRWDFNNVAFQQVRPRQVIPWRLTTQCNVDGRNVPVRDPYPII